MRFRFLVRTAQVVLAVEVFAFTISCLPGVRGEAGFDPLIDGWLQGSAYVTAAVLCALRPISVPDDRRMWSWLATALAVRALAFVLFLSVIREMEPMPYPSLADFGWLAFCALVLIALVTHIRENFTHITTSLILDGLVGALATSAIALALLYGTLVDLSAAGTPTDAVATNLAYPIADVLLLLVILGVLVAYHWRPPAAIWMLGAAVASFAVVDSVFLYQVTAGTFRPGGFISALSLVATSMIAFVAWVPPPRETRESDGALPGLVVPAVLALGCLGLLVYAGARDDVPATAIGLAAAGLVVGVVRAALTVRDLQALGRELRDQAEVVRASRDEAQRASRAKSTFVSGMSHELRTPLNSVVGFAQLIEMEADNADQRMYAQRIVGAGRHLVAMIDDLLDVARLEHGEVQPSIEPVSAAEVVREAVDLAEPLVRDRGLKLRCELELPGNHRALADFRHLRQVLLNLMSNAVKYNREGGEIVVSLSEPAVGTVRFAVADNGPGIAPDDLERLFRPFERLDAAKGAVPGTGLGLAVSKGLIEAMGGRIGVDSELGSGTTFSVDLPAAPEAADAGSSAKAAGGTGAWPAEEVLSATILYVEDNPADVQLMQGVFAGQPRLRLLTAASGTDALALAARHEPDVVLLDLHLPDMDGEEVLRELASHRSTTSIPVLVVSADATEERRNSCLSAGALGYLTKPLDVALLVPMLREVLQSHRGAAVTGPRISSGSSAMKP